MTESNASTASHLMKETTEELLQRKEALENGMAMAVVNGFDVDPNIERDISDLRFELRRRGFGNARVDRLSDWLGRTISGYKATEFLGEGRFAYLFKGTATFAAPKLLLVAKSPAADKQHLTTSKYMTDVFDLSLPPVSRAEISNDFALQKQAQIMRLAMPDLIEEIGQIDDRAYVRMSRLDGVSLRMLMNTPGFPLDSFIIRIFIQMIQELQHLRKAGVQHHGNLKPDYVMITKNGVKLLAPGFLGPINTPDGRLIPMAITTLEYYPFIEQDDILAIGIMLWEAVTKWHPLECEGDDVAARRIGPEFRKFLMNKIGGGLTHLTPLLRLQTPTEVRPGLPEALESILMRGLRLRFADDGSIELDKGFPSLSAFRTALESL
jgi:serine/threonine protein kinase